MEHNYHIGARRLAADLIIVSLREHEMPTEFYKNKTTGKLKDNPRYQEKVVRREEAKEWFEQRSDEPMGYLWCLSLANANGAQIRRAVHYLYNESGKLDKLKYKNL